MSVSSCSRAAMATLRCAGRSSTVDACVPRSAARQVHDGHTEPEDLSDRLAGRNSRRWT